MTASASVVLDVAAKYLREQYGASHGLDHPVDRARIIALLPHPAEQDAREAVARIVEDAAREGIRNYCLDRTDFTAAPFVRRILTLTQAAPDGWRLIETHDGSEDHVLIAEADGSVLEARLLDDGRGWWARGDDPDDYWTSELFPTHWTPLPPAPPAQGAGG